MSSSDPKHPGLKAYKAHRHGDVQLRIADAITSFAGSMQFIYLHVVIFAAWMLVVEKSPWPTLTLVVSLEAIFLSTFVLIGQNRQSDSQEAKAASDQAQVEKNLAYNTQLTESIKQLTETLGSDRKPD